MCPSEGGGIFRGLTLANAVAESAIVSTELNAIARRLTRCGLSKEEVAEVLEPMGTSQVKQVLRSPPTPPENTGKRQKEE